MLKCSLFTQASNLASAQEVPKWCPKCSIFNQTTKFGESPKKNAPSVQYSTKLQY
jgi:phage FluMu protein Com